MNLLTLTPEEYEQAMIDYNNYLQRFCRYKCYKNKYKKPVASFHFPVGKSVRKYMKDILKSARTYPPKI